MNLFWTFFISNIFIWDTVYFKHCLFWTFLDIICFGHFCALFMLYIVPFAQNKNTFWRYLIWVIFFSFWTLFTSDVFHFGHCLVWSLFIFYFVYFENFTLSFFAFSQRCIIVGFLRFIYSRQFDTRSKTQGLRKLLSDSSAVLSSVSCCSIARDNPGHFMYIFNWDGTEQKYINFLLTRIISGLFKENIFRIRSFILILELVAFDNEQVALI